MDQPTITLQPIGLCGTANLWTRVLLDGQPAGFLTYQVSGWHALVVLNGTEFTRGPFRSAECASGYVRTATLMGVPG